uniref:Uncharacterized protein n=1 Tax=Daphnia galeata TaxID=27404 RepID=A0A8J2RUF5_9CRUS|nr:unnamed protein product [Daphnia galeata]
MSSFGGTTYNVKFAANDLYSSKIERLTKIFCSTTTLLGWRITIRSVIVLSEKLFNAGYDTVPITGKELPVDFTADNCTAIPNLGNLVLDVQPHLDDYGIFRDKNHKFFRVRITKELVHKAKVYFIDHGRSQQLPRSEILSPVKSVTRLPDPPFEGFHKTRLSDEQDRLRIAIDLNRRLFHKYVRTIRVLEELLPSVYPMNMLIFKIGVLWSHWRWRVSESKSNEKNTGLTIPFLVRNLTQRDYNYSF